MEKAKIRQATEEDVPRILDLYNELTIHITKVETEWRPSLDDSLKVFAEISADPRHELLVAEYEGEIVGSLVLLTVPNLSKSATPWALLENLIVGERYRSGGFRSQILEYAVKRAREMGCHRIELCSDRRREEAHHLYLAVGFEDSAYGFRIYF